MPNCQLSKYSARLAAPMTATAQAKIIAALCVIGVGLLTRRYRAIPDRRSPSAVLTFISTAPGMRLRSAGIANAHPVRLAREARQITATTPRATKRRLSENEGVFSESRIIGRALLQSYRLARRNL